jgi:hypothetical protein
MVRAEARRFNPRIGRSRALSWPWSASMTLPLDRLGNVPRAGRELFNQPRAGTCRSVVTSSGELPAFSALVNKVRAVAVSRRVATSTRRWSIRADRWRGRGRSNDRRP